LHRHPLGLFFQWYALNFFFKAIEDKFINSERLFFSLKSFIFLAILREEYESRKEKLSRELETLLAFGFYEKTLRKQNNSTDNKPVLAADGSNTTTKSTAQGPNVQNLVFYDMPKIVSGIQMIFEAIGIIAEIVVGVYFLHGLVNLLEKVLSDYVKLILCIYFIRIDSWCTWIWRRCSCWDMHSQHLSR
jgi:hypothetical protein